MSGNNFTRFEFLGFQVRANVSWLFLAFLVTWSLADRYLPVHLPGLEVSTYWVLGFFGMVGLFFSLLFHEFAYALVARSRGLSVRGITLFLFGGVAEMEMEPDSPRTEFWMAIGGLFASVLLAIVFYLGFTLMARLDVARPITGLVANLSLMNVLLAAFNLVPGFPLDGGRMLRAILWRITGNLRRSTRWVTWLGRGFAGVPMFIGVAEVIYGDIIVGLWWVLIGLLLEDAAKAAYQRLLMQMALKGQRVRHIMTPDPVAVPPDTPLRAFVDDYLFRFGHDLFPVAAEDGRLIGAVTLRDLQTVPREEWDRVTVGEVVGRTTEDGTIGPDAKADDALSRMQGNGNGRLIVTENGRLKGVVVLKDLLHRLALRTEIEGTP